MTVSPESGALVFFVRSFADLCADERGAAMADYASLLALITLGVITALSLMGDSITTFFYGTADLLGDMTSDG